MSRKLIAVKGGAAFTAAALVVALGGVWARAQAPAPAPVKARYKATVLRPAPGATVTIRYVNPDKAEPPREDESLPITVRVDGVGPMSLRATTLPGVQGWRPWLFESASLRDLDGDKEKEVLIRAACHYGGSGGYQYLAIVRRPPYPDARYELITLPPVASENIHDGQFFAATDAKGRGLIVATTPLMDNEARPDPTHWRVSAYVLNGGDATPAPLWEKKPAKRYTEFLPVAAIKTVLPRGWRLGAEIR